MKTWRKLLALLLALAMAFAVAACDNSKDDKDEDKGSSGVQETKPVETEPPTEPEATEVDIYGEWTMKRDISGFMNDMLSMKLGEDMELPDESIDLYMTLEFDTDTEFIMSASLDEESFTSYIKALSGVVAEYMITLLDAQGVTQADFEAQAGMTLEEYVEEMMEVSLDKSAEAFEGEMFDGYFRLDGDKLYIEEDKDDLEDDESYMVVCVDSDELTVLEKVGKDVEETMEEMDMIGMEFPWVFERQ